VTNRSPALKAIVEKAVYEQGVVIFRGTAHQAMGDPRRFMHSGVPVIDFLGSPATYHSTFDSPENLSEEALEHIAHAAAQILEEADALSWEEIHEGAVPRPPLGDGSLPNVYIP
jgi:hypothetical protein